MKLNCLLNKLVTHQWFIRLHTHHPVKTVNDKKVFVYREINPQVYADTVTVAEDDRYDDAESKIP